MALNQSVVLPMYMACTGQLSSGQRSAPGTLLDM